jgi:hypothetical protein
VFIQHIIPDRRIQRGFKYASALTQQSIGRGIVDLVLIGTRKKKILVEIKIGAKETQTKIYGHGWVPQVRKYLLYRTGQVAFLTTRNVPSPDVNSRFFLGHFYLEELERHLNRHRLSVAGQLLLDFMEENDMKALEPFTKTDLNNAEHSFKFAKKCEAMLYEVVRIIEQPFKQIFRIRTRFTSAHFSPTYNSAYSYTRKFRYGSVKSVSVYLSPWDGKFGFGISIKIPKKDLEKINRYLQWEAEKSELFTWHILGLNVQPAKLAKDILSDAKSLRSALNRVYKKK